MTHLVWESPACQQSAIQLSMLEALREPEVKTISELGLM